MRKILATIFALAVVIACSPVQPAGEQTISVIVESSSDVAASKIWSPGDYFYATIHDDATNTWYHNIKFNFEGSAPATRGWFTATMPVKMQNASLWASVPSQKGEDREFTVDITSQSVAKGTERQQGCVAIVAKKNFITGGKVTDVLTFQPLTSEIKLTIKNSDAQMIVVKRIEVSSSEKIFSLQARINNTSLSTDDPRNIVYTPQNPTSKISANLSQGNLASEEVLSARLGFFPLNTIGAAAMVTVVYTQGDKECSFSETVALAPSARGQLINVDLEIENNANILKLMSSNIRLVTSSDTGDTNWSVRKTAYVKMLKTNLPDVVGIQEIRDEQASFILENLGDTYAYCSPRVDGVADSQCGHTGLLYNKVKFTLLDKGHFWLSDTPDKPSTPKNWGAQDLNYRTCYWVHLKDKVTGKTFFYFTSHLPYKAGDTVPRKNAAELCLSRMKAALGSSSEPIFFGGDMNIGLNKDGCLNAVYEWMGDSREKSPITDYSRTFNGWGNSNSVIDYIFFKNAIPLKFHVDNSPDYGVTYVSDHFPIIFETRIN